MRTYFLRDPKKETSWRSEPRQTIEFLIWYKDEISLTLFTLLFYFEYQEGKLGTCFILCFPKLFSCRGYVCTNAKE